MKKRACLILVLLAFITLILFLPSSVAFAKNNNNFDQVITEILNGINEEDFSSVTQTLNKFFGDESTFKERLLSFITGEFKIDFSTIKNFIISTFPEILNSSINILIYVIFLGIMCSSINIIILKNKDKSEKNTIYFICYTLAITGCAGLIYNLFNYAQSILFDLSEKIELIFPILFSISMLAGNFGISLYKPYTAFVSFFCSSIVSKFFIPILSLACATVVCGNLNTSVKLSSLSSTIFSFFKWCMGIVGIVFSALISIQTIVNAGYNGISYKVLKYATGSLIPVVGGFLSGGLDLFLSSSLLIKNSIGLIAVLYMAIKVFLPGLTLLIVSFVIKFLSSLTEPVIDKRFLNVITGISDVIKNLASLIFLCGFLYLITVIGFIFTTFSVV